MRDSRPIGWVKAARRTFERLPQRVQDRFLDALSIAAEGRKADIAKPLKGLGSGVLEIAVAHRGDAYRVVYALAAGEEMVVVHAFQKKSSSGRKTPKKDVDLVRQRLKWLTRRSGA